MVLSRSTTVALGAILFLVAGVIAPGIQAATFSTNLTVAPMPAGSVHLNFTATQGGGNPIVVDVFRLVSTTQPILAQFTPGTQIANDIPVVSAVPTTLVNTSVEITNVANGFLPATITVSQGRYWYLVRAIESGQPDANSVIQGGVADVNPPSTLSAGQFIGDCTDALPNIDFSFVNPFDGVVNSDSNIALNPGSVTQFAQPTASFRMRFLLYRVAQSEAFDVVNDPIPGNIITTQEILPTYNRGAVTSYTDVPPGGTAWAYGLRVIDTVGNQNGGSPLSQNQVLRAISPPDDLTVTQALVSGVAVNCVSFTVNIPSLISDPLDITPAIIHIYARTDGAPVTTTNLGTSFIIGTINRSSGGAAEEIVFYHEPTNPVLPRQNGVTYSYGTVIVTDNNMESCVSNSEQITTTDIIPPVLIALKEPLDNAKVNGVTIFSATVQDDALGQGIQSVTFELNDQFIGVDNLVVAGTAVACASITFDTSLLSDGVYILSATASDFGGNLLVTGSGDPGAGPNHSILIDNTPATVAFTSPAAGVGVNGMLAVTGTAVDANATIISVTLTYNSTTVPGTVVATGAANWSGTVPIDPLFNDDDIFTVTAEALDDCGLVGVSARSFCVDNECATIIPSVTSQVFGPSGLTITGTAVDDDIMVPCETGIALVSFESTATGNTLTSAPITPPQLGVFNYSITSTFGMADGQSGDIIVSATDGAIDEPNTCSVSILNVTADYSPPVCALVSPVTAAIGVTHTISGTAMDVGAAGLQSVCVEIFGPVNSVTSYIPGATFSSIFSPGVDGLYSIVISATDNVGNTTTCDAVTVRIDTMPPVVDITSPLPPNIGVNGTFLLQGTASDVGSGVQLVNVEYTTSGGTSTVGATVVPVGGLAVVWSAIVPVDGMLSDDDLFAVTATAVDGSSLTGTDVETYFVDNTDSCPSLITPTAGSSTILGASGLSVSLMAADDDPMSMFDTGVSAVSYQVALNGVTGTLLLADPAILGVTTISAVLDPVLDLGLADGDVTDVSFCLVDGATGTANVCCVTVEVAVDLSPPLCSIDAPLDNSCIGYSNTILGATTITISATDAIAGLAIIGFEIIDADGDLVDSVTTSASGLTDTASFLYTFTNLGDGIYDLVAVVTDTVGNGGACSTITFTVSTQGPLSDITSPRRAVINTTFNVSGFSVAPTFAAGSAGLPGPGTPAGQSPVVTGEDDPILLPFNGGFVFPFFGTLYNEVWVSPNGFLTFGAGDDDFSESIAEFQAGPPRIAVHWDDFNPVAGGTMTYEQQSDRAIFRYTNVPQFGLSDQNTFSATLYSTGAILFQYGAVNASDGLVGVAPGFGGPIAAVDISAASPVILGSTGTYQRFTAGQADLDNAAVAFLPQNDLTGAGPATLVDLWYPGAGGSVLPPLSATVEAMVAPSVVPFVTTPINSDQGAEILFANGFEFPFFGKCWTSVWISTHGFLEFGQNTTPLPVFAPTPGNVNGPTPKILAFMGDIDGSQGGGTTYQQFDDRFRVVYNGVPTTGGSDINDITVTLFITGAVTVDYGTLGYLTTPDFLSTGVGVGVSAGVSGQPINGFESVPLTTNGVLRAPVNLSAQGGAPVQINATNKVLYERFSGVNPFDLAPGVGFQGTALSTTLTPNAEGRWSTTLVVDPLLCTDGDPFSVSAKGFGGCLGETRGPSANHVYGIDYTDPTLTFNVVSSVSNCIGLNITALGILNDAGNPAHRIDSGICGVTLEVWQGGILIGTVDETGIRIGTVPIRNFLPWGPDQGPLPYNVTVPATQFNIAPNTLFGLNLVVEDCAIADNNTTEAFPGVVPEIYTYDPVAPDCGIVAPLDGACFSFESTVLGASDVIITATDGAGCLDVVGFRIENAFGMTVASITTTVAPVIASATFSYPFMSLPDGSYFLIASATDIVGNGTDCPPISFTVRREGPSIFNVEPFVAVVNDNVDISGIVADPVYAMGSGGVPAGPFVPTTSATLALNDDSFTPISLPFEFPFFGNFYTEAFLGSNGYITFFAGDTDLSENIGDFENSQPRIAFLWDDIHPGTGGQITYETGVDRVVLTFSNIPEFFATGSNTVVVTLYSTGAITMAYGGLTLTDGLVGVSPGDGTVSTAVDLSAGTPFTMGSTGIQELFTAPPNNDLANTTIVFLPTNDVLGFNPASATSVDLWYPGPGGGPLAPLDATTEALVSPSPVFSGGMHSANSQVEVAFGNGFEFPFYGACYSEVHISARGLLEFGEPSSPIGVPTLAAINSAAPKVMPLWSALDASGVQGGTTTYRQYDDRFIVDFVGVPDDAGNGVNTFSAILYNTGAVEFIYSATDVTTSNISAVGISAAVQDRPADGSLAISVNGFPRASTDLSGVAGAPATAAVTDKALFELFGAASFDLAPTYGIQGTSLAISLVPNVSGEWSANLPISATFCGDGDPFAVSAKAFGGCNGITRGDSRNRTYAIDRTAPGAQFTAAFDFQFGQSIPLNGCVNSPFVVFANISDIASSAARVSSGICQVTTELVQNNVVLATETVLFQPPFSNPGSPGFSFAFAGIFDPVSSGLQPGPFGFNFIVEDCAVNIPNVSDVYGANPPNVLHYDPIPPLSQPVASRLFIAAATDVMGASITTLFELHADTGAVLAELALPDILSSTVGSCALGSEGNLLYYADTNAASGANTIYVFDVSQPGSIVLAASLTTPASVTEIRGLGAENGLLYVSPEVGSASITILDAQTGAFVGYTPSPFPQQAEPYGIDSVGSGLFGRTFFSYGIDPAGPATFRETFFESFDGENLNIVSPLSVPGLDTTGIGFSGTRIFQGRATDGMIREVETTFLALVFSGGPLNSFPVPGGQELCAVAASAAIPPVTLCAGDFPYNLTTAMTDTAPCGFFGAAFFLYDCAAGPQSASIVHVATDLPSGLIQRNFDPDDLSSAAIARAVLDITQALSIIPSGEGQICFFTQAADDAYAIPNLEDITAAITRGVTFTIDIVPPRVLSLATMPKAATSGYAQDVTLTAVFEDRAAGLNVTDESPTINVLLSDLGGGALDELLTFSSFSATDALGRTTGTAVINLAALTLPSGNAFIDFIVSATDHCNNASSTLLINRFIIDDTTPCADDPDPFYPALDVIANGTGTGTLWDFVNANLWTLNEMINMDVWDATFAALFPFSLAGDPQVLAGDAMNPLNLMALVGDCVSLRPAEPFGGSAPSGVALVEILFATGTETMPPPIPAFANNLIGIVTGAVQLAGGGPVPCEFDAAAASSEITIQWFPNNLPPTTPGSNDYIYFKMLVTDFAGNTLDPIFGPFLLLDITPPEPIIITARALFGTPDVRLDWERRPFDNVGTVGYEIFRTRDTVDDVLDANPLTDFDLLATIPAIDGLGQDITEYLDQSIPPEGVYAYYVVPFDAAGNGRTGGSGLASNISNIVAAAPNDLVDPYPVTDLKVRAGEPEDGIRLAWNIPSNPIGGGPIRPTGDNVAIAAWEIFRDQRTTPLVNSDVSEPDGDIVRNPDLLIATVLNLIVPDFTTPTASLRFLPVEVIEERATISATTPEQILLFMPPLNASHVTRVFNQSTGETYGVVAVASNTVEVTGTLPSPNDVVLVDYLTESRSFVDTQVVPGLPYSYAVVGRDAAGNRALISTSVLVGDSTAEAFDTTPPEIVDTLQGQPVGNTEDIFLNWDNTPYDQVGVAGYNIFRRRGEDPIEFASHHANTLISRFKLPQLDLAPIDATVTATLPVFLGGVPSGPFPPAAPSLLGLGDDDFTSVPLPFTFPFYGGTYDAMFVGSNGYITFGSGDSSLGESIVDFENGPPRISLFWNDVNPSSGGSVTVESSASRVIVSFDNVPEFPSTGANTARAILYPNGAVVVEYGALTMVDGLAGVTPGGGNVASAVDISTGGPFVMGANGFVELLSPNDLAGQTVVYLPVAPQVTPIDEELLLVIDTTTNRIIHSMTDTVDLLNDTYYFLNGAEITIVNIPDSPSAVGPMLHNIKVITFNEDLSLFNGAGFDAQLSYYDDTPLGGKTYNYAVMAVDPWGNMADLSNSAQAIANDLTPPATPTVEMVSLCTGLEDFVAITPNPADDDVGSAVVFGDPFLSFIVGTAEAPNALGDFLVPIGDNEIEEVWVVVRDWSGNTSPSVVLFNDITPPLDPDPSEITLTANPPGFDDTLIVKPFDPEVVYVVVYSEPSTFNEYAVVEDGDDGLVDGCWTVNLGDNQLGDIYVAYADEFCNESNDLPVLNDIAPPSAPISVQVQNNVVGTQCDRTPVDDTLTAWVGPDVVAVKVYGDIAQTNLVAFESLTAPNIGPSGSLAGPINIGNNYSFNPFSLSSVYVVACDAAGNNSEAAHAEVDIQAPEIASLEIFEQFPQQPGTFPRVEDEVDVQIDLDTAEENEVLCVKIYSEAPTLNRETPSLGSFAGVNNLTALAAGFGFEIFGVAVEGATGVADDVLASSFFGILDSSFLNPSALAIANLGSGNVWVASSNPVIPNEIRLTEYDPIAPGRVQDIDLPIPGPVAGMTFAGGDVLYFVTAVDNDVYAFDTVLNTLSVYITGGFPGVGRGIAGADLDRLYLLYQEDASDPLSGRLAEVDIFLDVVPFNFNLTNPSGLALDRLGVLHYTEGPLVVDGELIQSSRVSEYRPNTDGPLVLIRTAEYQTPVPLAGPTITENGFLLYADSDAGFFYAYDASRRSTQLPDLASFFPIPPFARILAERVPGPDFRVEGVRIGDNLYSEVVACVVDRAGNTSFPVSAINDVVGPTIYDAVAVEGPPGFEDAAYGFSDPFTVVRSYLDSGLENEIDRNDNAVRADRFGLFGPLAIGDNLYHTLYFASEDEAGNISTPAVVFNDIFAPDPAEPLDIFITSNCPGTDDEVYGLPGSVEPDSFVLFYEDPNLALLITDATANVDGSFGPVSLGDNLYDVVWVAVEDQAGNLSIPIALDGVFGAPINDLEPPQPIDLDNVQLAQLSTGEDLLTGLADAVDRDGVAYQLRVYTDAGLTSELGGGLSPIFVNTITGGWPTATLGTNVMINNVLTGFRQLWVVVEDDACNQSEAVRIDLDVEVPDPTLDRFEFSADVPNHNTVLGLEGAVGANVTVQFATGVADFGTSLLALPILGYANSDEAGAFQAIDLGRVGQAFMWGVVTDSAGNVGPIFQLDTPDLVPPAAPDRDAILLTQRGRSFPDLIEGLRGAVGLGEEDLTLRAYRNAELTEIIAGFPLAIPKAGFNGNPGAFPSTAIGDNYADNTVNPAVIVGTPYVWLTASDEFGNESQPTRIDLDVVVKNPDPTKVFVISKNPQTDATITGLNQAVEPNSRVLVTADVNSVLIFGNFYADGSGGWEAVNIGSLLRQPDVVPGAYGFPQRRDVIYVRSIDAAGNRSAAVPISVEIVTYAVLDAFGGITLRNGLDSLADAITPSFLPEGVARDLEPGFFRANGALPDGFTPGDPALPEFTASPSGFYRMTGLGEVVALGDVLPVDQAGFTPYTTDLAKDIEISSAQPGPAVGFYQLDADGGIRVFGGASILTGISLGGDLARALELDFASNGAVQGGYILDGQGGLTPLGSSVPFAPASAFLPGQDVFVDFEIVRNPATLSADGALVLSKFGDIEIAGTVDPDVIFNAPTFGFNIARDLEVSINQETGQVRGVYILDGFGGIHTGGAAPKIHDAPFFGFDVARDLAILRGVDED